MRINEDTGILSCCGRTGLPGGSCMEMDFTALLEHTLAKDFASICMGSPDVLPRRVYVAHQPTLQGRLKSWEQSLLTQKYFPVS